MARTPASYEKKYAGGAGWAYDFATERDRLKLITDAIGLRRGDAVLEIGCGEGFHSHVLYEMGFRITGNEKTEAGVATGRERHPLVNYIQGDTLEVMDRLPHDHFDMILARGHSWWHYRLGKGENPSVDVPACTARLFDHLKPGGHFVLCIRTDFTGTHTRGKVSNNAWQDYVDLFSPLGEIVYLTDFRGRPLPDDAAARKSGNSIVIATRKPGGPATPIGERVRRALATTTTRIAMRARKARAAAAKPAEK